LSLRSLLWNVRDTLQLGHGEGFADLEAALAFARQAESSANTQPTGT
jgi:hypothetical protein